MLTNKMLDKILGEAVKGRYSTYTTEQLGLGRFYRVALYDNQSKHVATLYLSEGDTLGNFEINFVTKKCSQATLLVLQSIQSQLFNYFDGLLEPKYFIRPNGNENGYLALPEDGDYLYLTTLELAQENGWKVAYTADEINDLVEAGDFGDLGLWEVVETAPGFPG